MFQNFSLLLVLTDFSDSTVCTGKGVKGSFENIIYKIPIHMFRTIHKIFPLHKAALGKKKLIVSLALIG